MSQIVEFMKGNAIIATGAATGDPCRVEDVEVAQPAPGCQLLALLSAGVMVGNLDGFFGLAPEEIL